MPKAVLAAILLIIASLDSTDKLRRLYTGIQRDIFVEA